jgi:uncharacterized protein (DUF885 family)
MIERRAFVISAAIAAMLPAFRAGAAPDGATPNKLDALFTKFVQEQMQRSPELATALGLDTGPLAPLKSRLSDASLAAIAQDKKDNARRIAELSAIPRTGLSGIQAANYDTVMFLMQVQDEGDRLFDYGTGGSGAPYVLSQLTGAYQQVPDFLDTQHSIETAADAEAYLARMAAFATVMDQETAVLHHDAALGVVPPDFVIDKTLVQMHAFLATPADQAVMVRSLGTRCAAKKLDGAYATRAASLYRDKILPALGRQADALSALRAHAVHDAGVARLPKGGDYYRVSLKQYTTASIQPAEIHRTGLDLVASLSAGIDAALRAQGMGEGSVGRRLRALADDPKYLYANTDEAKIQLIADLNKRVAVVQAKLPQYFDALPKAHVQIRRVPKATEAGAPGGYYQPGSLDGKRPGAYYINLRDTAEVPKWALPTLTYHESIPGHHLQLTLAQETPGLPLIRKIVFFSGYGEGWALYAEQLAVEMGLYDNDPFGHIGQMQAALFRAVRLVVDSGMHAQGWSREKAIDYFVDTLGEKPSSAITEVERYCVWPGQACSYMIGKLTWLRVRDSARHALGAKFDLKKFHDAGLLSGALPLDVLETQISAYVAEAKG